MVERGNIQVERDLANGLFAWLQLSQDESPPPLNETAQKFTEHFSLSRDDLLQIRSLISSLDTAYILPLQLHVAGFEESVVRQLDSQDVFDEALELFNKQCEALFDLPDQLLVEAAVEAEEPVLTHKPAKTKPITPNIQVKDRRLQYVEEPSDSELAKLEDIDVTKDISDTEVEKLAGTRLDADLVNQYLKELRRFPLLVAEQEVEIAKAIEAGLFARERLDSADELSAEDREDLEMLAHIGMQQKDLLINSNLRLVVSITKRYNGRGMLFLDLIQEGNTGLIRAVEKFDYTKGYKFSTYATWWIRQAATRALADQGRTIRIPVHMIEVINKLSRGQRQMMQDLGRDPTTEELAKEFSMTPEKVLEVQKYARHPISLHTPFGEEGGLEFGDLIEDTSDEANTAGQVLRDERYETLCSVLMTLTEREEGVMRARFGLDDGVPKTLEELGMVYGVTKERIRQIEAKTLSKLRHPSRSYLLAGLKLPGSS